MPAEHYNMMDPEALELLNYTIKRKTVPVLQTRNKDYYDCANNQLCEEGTSWKAQKKHQNKDVLS